MTDSKRVKIQGGRLERPITIPVHVSATGYGWRPSRRPGGHPALIVAQRLPHETADGANARVSEETGVVIERFVSESATERCREVECVAPTEQGYYVVDPIDDVPSADVPPGGSGG